MVVDVDEIHRAFDSYRVNPQQFLIGFDKMEEVPLSLVPHVYEGQDPLGFVAVREVKRVIAGLRQRVDDAALTGAAWLDEST